MAIISASRRTDIPTFFSQWFLNRLDEGYLMVRNPYKHEQVSKIILSEETIDCIVFWTKNPLPMLYSLDKIKYPYYFQFTLTGYGRDMESGLPDKNILIDAFTNLQSWGNGHAIWRYDPIVITNTYTPEWHIAVFAKIAKRLAGYTDKCVISFVDSYANNKARLESVGAKTDLYYNTLYSMASQLAHIAHECGMSIASCAEPLYLAPYGIEHNRCIDPDYIEKIIGKPIKRRKDAAQREECGCIESVEVGTYSTCRNGCKYCYALKDPLMMAKSAELYDPVSPLLCDSLQGDEIITERKLTSMVDYKELEKYSQLSFF